MKKTVIPIVVALILAGSFVLVANIASNTAIGIKNKGYVTVKGFAKQEIKSDLGIFKATIITENPDLKVCYAELAQNKDQVKKFVNENFKVTAQELELNPASIKEVYKINERGYDTDEFVKYILKQNIKIEGVDVEKIEKISSGMIEILDKGVKISIHAPEYLYTKLEDLKIEMIGRATNNARQRVIKIAQEGKFRLGPIASVRVGIFQITPANSTEVSNYGINDTTSIEKEIKCVVEIKYFVK